MRRSIRVTRQIEAPPEAVFPVLADHAHYDRFDGIRRAELVEEGVPAPNGLGAVRWVWLGPLRFEEQVTAFEPPVRLDYLIRDVRGLPFSHEGGSIRLSPTETGTDAVWTSSFEIPIPVIGAALDPIFTRPLERGFAHVLERSAQISTELERKDHAMSSETETAILAGGCYWTMQQLLRERDGVISTRAGWTGGENENPTEENNSGHAEAVEVVFDPERVSYRELLEYFFMVHRPDLGEDAVGSGYRSEIFYTTDEQRRVAEETIPDVDASGHWPGSVVTEISEAGRFWEVGPEEQGYFDRYPEGCPSPFPRTGAPAG